MKTLNSKVAVVTGAASGIGRELAINLAGQGCRLALSDVNEAGLAETVAKLRLADSMVSSHRVDVSNLQEVNQFAANVIAVHGQVDIVINNAGLACRGFIDDVDYETFERVINVNLWGVIYGNKAFLPYLKQRPEASLVNISSINGMVPFPSNGPYNISKYAVLGLNETLMIELKGTSVQILSVHPGGIQTNIANNAINADDETAQKMNRLFKTTAAEAADAIVTGIKAGKSQIFIGNDAKIAQRIKRIWPKAAFWLSSKAMEKLI